MSKLGTFRRSDAAISGLTFAGRADRLAAAAEDATIALWDVAQPASPHRIFQGHNRAARAVAFAERGPFLASGGADSAVKLWALDKGELIRTYRGHEEPVAAVVFEAQGRTLA